ncbi:YfbM family protein [Fusobacterium nucleatum]
MKIFKLGGKENGNVWKLYFIGKKELEKLLNGNKDFDDIESVETLDIDKSWQAIQYLLGGDICEIEGPLGYVVPMLVENAIDCDSEFGVFYITTEQIKEAYDALFPLTKEDLLEKYNFSEMLEDEVYPIVEDDDEKEFFDYIYSYLLEIKEFYKKNIEKELAILFYIS